MKKLVLFTLLSVLSLTCKAQFVYEGNSIKFNGDRYKTYMTTWNGWAHAWVNGNNVVKLNLSAADPRFATNKDKIVFMDSERGAYNDIYARNYYNYSDAAAKTNVASFRSATKTILSLRPVTYQWVDQAEYLRYKKTSPLSSNPKEIGFIAQEVERVLPDIIGIDSDGNKLVNYTAIIPVLTAAIQELNARVEYLEKQLNIKK